MKVMRLQWKKENGGYSNFLQLKESFTVKLFVTFEFCKNSITAFAYFYFYED